MHLFLTRKEIVKILFVQNVRKSIALNANQMLTRNSHARNSKRIEILTFLIRLFRTLSEDLNSSNVPRVPFGSKKL